MKKHINKNDDFLFELNSTIAVKRLTALWAFSEAALGGILHAARIPFTGLFIGGVAVILISLIYNVSGNKSEILKATLLVILIKGVVSPYTPVAAYFAVFVQGCLGYILFSFIRSKGLASILLGFFAMLFASMQKVIIYTIVYGATLWESIDFFGSVVFEKFGLSESNSDSFKFSFLLIGIYMFIHLAGGLVAGMIGARVPFWIRKNLETESHLKNYRFETAESAFSKIKVRKVWWKKKSYLFLIGITLVLFLSTLFAPELKDDLLNPLLFMFLRAIVIILLWYKVLYPIVSKLVEKFLVKKSSKYKKSMEEILFLFPRFKNLLAYSWRYSRKMGRIRGIKHFISTSLILILFGTVD